MSKLTVIGTFHTEDGACTLDELYQIIEEIAPEVIFFEAPPETFPAMLKATENFNTPEIKVVRAIIEKHSKKIIPVDIPDAFNQRFEAMFKLFKKMNNEYFCATEIQFNETHRLGFPYLNSKDSDQIHKDKNSMEKVFVSRAKNDQLSKTHKDWLHWNDKRENHWINVIHDYFEKNNISKAVFLVGSAHRIRLMEKIKNFQDSSKSISKWDFFPFG